MEIELEIKDSCLEPEIFQDGSVTRVVIGPNHDYDNILDVASPVLDGAGLHLLFRLWSDDDFPRTFKRVGGSLIITERK